MGVPEVGSLLKPGRVVDYGSAAQYLDRAARAGERPAGNNTRVVRRGNGTVAIHLHHTDVVVYERVGIIRLHNGGYQTVTTKDRLNRHTPKGWRVRQEDFTWYVTTPQIDGEIVFEDGMAFHRDGSRFPEEDE